MRRRENNHRHFERHSKLSHDPHPQPFKSGLSGGRHFEAIHLSIPAPCDIERPDERAVPKDALAPAVPNPHDALSLEELNAFAAEVADWVEESRLATIEDRLKIDMERLEIAGEQLPPGVQMRATRTSASLG